MEINVQVTGKQEGKENIFLVSGKTSDGRKLISSVVVKGDNVVLQAVPKAPQKLEDDYRIIGFTGGIVLEGKGKNLKSGSKLNFKKVDIDASYSPSESNNDDVKVENELLKQTLAKNEEAMKRMADTMERMAKAGESAGGEGSGENSN